MFEKLTLGQRHLLTLESKEHLRLPILMIVLTISSFGCDNKSYNASAFDKNDPYQDNPGAIGNPSGASNGGLSLSEYRDQTSELYCSKIFECCPNGIGGVPDYDSCVDNVNYTYDSIIQKSLSLGYLKFDSEKASKCISVSRAPIEDQSCDEAQTTVFKDCKGVIIGEQEEGESCSFDLDENSRVSSDGYCKDGLICEEIVLDRYLCVKGAESGEACDHNNRCMRLHDCREDVDGDSFCKKLSFIGESCAENADCIDNFCSDEICKTKPMDLCD